MEAKIDEMFTPDDVLDIKQVAIGGPGSGDVLTWNYTKSGQFTVRSAYHLRMPLTRTKIGQPESSSSVSKHKSRLSLWSNNAPGKAKILDLSAFHLVLEDPELEKRDPGGDPARVSLIP